MTVVVNISDAKASGQPEHVLATYSLGSCIGVAAYDPVSKVGGMLHFQLPTASLDANRAKANPMMFADSGMAELIGQMESLGAQRRRLKVKIAGGAQILNDNGLFNIGRRNHAAIRKILWQNGMFLDGEDIGGGAPRNLYLQIADGAVVCKTHGESKTL